MHNSILTLRKVSRLKSLSHLAFMNEIVLFDVPSKYLVKSYTLAFLSHFQIVKFNELQKNSFERKMFLENNI